MDRIDAAYCYRRSSVVCVYVCVRVTHPWASQRRLKWWRCPWLQTRVNLMNLVSHGGPHWRQLANAIDRSVWRRRCGLWTPSLWLFVCRPTSCLVLQAVDKRAVINAVVVEQDGASWRPLANISAYSRFTVVRPVVSSFRWLATTTFTYESGSRINKFHIFHITTTILCTAAYRYVLQPDLHVLLICVIKFYLLTYLFTYKFVACHLF